MIYMKALKLKLFIAVVFANFMSTYSQYCPPGAHVIQVAPYCRLCSPGYYSANHSPQPGCNKCPIGQYSNKGAKSDGSGHEGSTGCLQCQAGTFNTEDGLWGCTDCSVGTYSAYVAATSATVCTSCVPGRHSDAAGQSSCAQCGPGDYSSAGAGNVGSTSCTECIPGTWSFRLASSCTSCLKGEYSSRRGQGDIQGNSPCLDCEAGEYGDEIGLELCKLCEAGKKQPNRAATSCTACAAGRYSSSGATECTTCAAGKYSSSGASICIDCTAGKSSSSGATSCTVCAAGFWDSMTWSSTPSCNECSPGFYTPDAGRYSGCDPCVEGEFGNGNGAGGTGYASTECMSCGDPPWCDEGSIYPDTCDMGTGEWECEMCGEGTFGGGGDSNTCEWCPSDSTSEAGSYSYTECKCVYGNQFLTEAVRICNWCAAGTFMSDIWGGVGEDCAPCPTGTNSIAGSTAGDGYSRDSAIQACKCLAGYTAVADGVACSACVSGTFKVAVGTGSCETCPANSESSSGSALCQCSVGFKGGDGGPCISCDIGEYKDTVGDDSCIECPSLMSSVAGSNAATDCMCIAGYTTGSNGIACRICDAGTYKAAIGTGICTNCGTGTYSTASGASECSPCAVDTYIDTTGATACSVCPIQTSSPTGSKALTACKCVAGYTAVSDGVQCSSCAAGKYKTITGASACITCPSGTTSTTEKRALSDCRCQKGFTGNSNGVVCTACGVGTYKTSTGIGVCSTCPSGTSSGAGSDSVGDCICVAGYTATSDGVACSLCVPGKYKAVTGVGSCTDCPGGTDSSSGSSALIDCTCIPGTSGNSDGSCTECPVGTYQDTDECEPCAYGYYNDVPGNTNCKLCPTGTSVPLDSTGSAECIPCVAGTYKAAKGTGDCTDCPDWTNSLSGSDSVGDCICVAGYTATSDGVVCAACGAGKYKTSTGTGVCSTCPARTSSGAGSDSVGDCICVVGYTANTEGVACSACEQGTYKAISGSLECSSCPVNSVSSPGSALCQCSAGYSGSDGGPCIPCSVATYKSTVGSESCEVCPSLTSSPSGSDELTDCTCMAGYSGTNGVACIACETGTYKDTTGVGDCLACPIGTYKGDTGSGVCSSCPVNTFTAVGSDGIEDCRCYNGHTADTNGVACSACEVGTYKDSTGAGDCSSCPMGTSTAQGGSKLLTECTCLVGYTADSDGVQCSGCDTGMYKASAGVGQCSTCPTGTSSPSVSDALTDCTCLVGHTAASNGVECSECDTGMYKASTGVGQCSTCPAGTSSPSASDALTDCTCLSGYSGTSDGVACEACEAGFCKIVTGVGQCFVCLDTTKIKFMDLGHALTPCAGVGQQDVCITCERGSFWNEPTLVPNTPLSIVHEAGAITGNAWRYAYKYSHGTYGLLFHFPFDDDRLENMAPFGPPVGLLVDNIPVLVQPGRVGMGSTYLGNGASYTLGDRNDYDKIVTLDGVTSLTVAVWVRFDVDSTVTVFKSNVFDINDGVAGVRIYFRGENGVQAKYTTSGTAPNTWKHISVVADLSIPSIQVYINGEEYPRYTPTNDNTVLTAQAFERFHIGNPYGGTWGGVDDFRFYNRQLSTQEVAVMVTPSTDYGLFLHFTFDDASLQNTALFGPAVSLLAGGGYDLWKTPVTSCNAPTLVQSGRVGTAYASMGSNVCYIIPSTFDFSIFDNVHMYTLSIWIQLWDGSGSWTHIIDSNHGIELTTNPARNIRMRIRGGGFEIGYSLYTVPIGPWIHVTVAVDETNCRIALYIDSEWEEDIVNDGCILGPRVSEIWVGGRTGFSGNMDDLRLYNRLLSADEVAALNNANTGLYDRAACAAAVSVANGDVLETVEIPASCWAEVVGTAVGHNSAVIPDVQSSFPFYCTSGARVSFVVHQRFDSLTSYTHPIRFKVDNQSAWLDGEIAQVPLNFVGWGLPSPTTLLSIGTHTLIIGASVGVGSLSHVRFAEGVGTCYFFTDSNNDTSVCTQCPQSNPSTSTGSVSSADSCTVCAVGSFFSEITKECIVCVAGSIVTGIDDGRSCNKCPRGTYAGTDASTSCRPCESNSYADTLGSTACIRCPFDNMTTLPHDNTCVCLPGFTFTGEKCELCLAGSFRSDEMLHTTACTSCPGNSSNTMTGSASCDCAEFYSSTSKQTAPWKYTISHPDEECEPWPGFQCGDGEYQSDKIECSPCPNNSETMTGTSIMGITACNCNQGYGGVSSCDACAIGHFKATVGMHVCEKCPVANGFADNSVSTNTVGATHSSMCYCNMGFEPDGTNCIQCNEDFYKSTLGDTPCEACPDGLKTYGQYATSVSHCICEEGSGLVGVAGDSTRCQKCGNESYTQLYEHPFCLSCPENSTSFFTDNTECECFQGFYADVCSTHDGVYSLECNLCPVGTYASMGQTSCTTCPHTTTTETVGTTSIDGCVCSPGMYATSTSTQTELVCSTCTVENTYQPNYSSDITDTCKSCPEGSDTTDYISCICIQGYEVVHGSNICTICLPSYYAPQDNGMCVQCQHGTVGSEDRTTCECMPGFEYSGEDTYVYNPSHSNACTECSARTFKSSKGAEKCSGCVAGTYSNDDGATACMSCPTGKFSSANARTCSPCLAGTSSNGDGQSQCTPCGPNEWAGAEAASCISCASGTIGHLGDCVCEGNRVPLNTETDTTCTLSNTEVCGTNLQCTACVGSTGTHGILGARSCTACPRGQIQTASGDVFTCSSCTGSSLCDNPGQTKPICTSQRMPCETCNLLVSDAIKCFGYLQLSSDCVDNPCIMCNIGLVPDGKGGCRSTGRRTDSVAYDDDEGRVFDTNGTVLWGAHKRVLRDFSYGAHLTCGIEQFTNHLYSSNDHNHKLRPDVHVNTLRTAVSVDCRYEYICALYYTPPDITQSYSADTTLSGDAVECLGSNETLLPFGWAATSIVQGDGYACVLLNDIGSSVYCWGQSVWGSVPYETDTIWRSNARKIIALKHTTCIVDRDTGYEQVGQDEFGRVYCWGFAYQFFGALGDSGYVTTKPSPVLMPKDTYARDIVLVDTTSPANNNRESTAVCMLLNDYQVVCVGSGVHATLKLPWRIGPYYQSFPTGICNGPTTGELCIVFNQYEVLCWSVRDEPPLPDPQNTGSFDTGPGSIVDVIEPTLFYYRHQKNNHVETLNSSEPLLLHTAALIYPDSDAGQRCRFNIAYCASNPDGFNKVPMATSSNISPLVYPLVKRWYYLLDLAGLTDGDTILYLPELGKSIRVYRYMEEGMRPAGYPSSDNDDGVQYIPPNWSYLTWSSNAGRLPEGDYTTQRVTVWNTPESLQGSLMFVSVQQSGDMTHTNINVSISSPDVLISGHPDTTFHEKTTDINYQLPELDAGNMRIVWIALVTGEYTDRWINTETLWKRYNRLMKLTPDPLFMVHRLSMKSPHNSATRVGICPENHYNTNTNYTTDAICIPCEQGTVKPLAHLTNCMQYSFVDSLDGVDSVSPVLYLKRGFDGSIRYGTNSSGVTTIAMCTDGTVPNPYILDDSGNPRCSTCLSLLCKPWETEGVGCDPLTGSRRCIPNGDQSLCPRWLDSSMSCVDFPNHVVVDKETVVNEIGTLTFERTYETVSLNIKSLRREPAPMSSDRDAQIAQYNALFSYAKPLQRMLSESRYDILSLGTGVDLLKWKTSINPTATVGVYWMYDMSVFDFCIGSLRIRYRRHKIEVSIPSPDPEALFDIVLAETEINIGTFTQNPAVVYSDYERYTPLYYVTNVTVELRTHGTGEFALSTSIEIPSVLLYTLGVTLDLNMSYTTLYEHIARVDYPIHASSGHSEVFPYVYMGVGFNNENNNILQYEKLFLGPSHFFTMIPSSNVSNAGLNALALLAPCLDTQFVKCHEVKGNIVSWNESTTASDLVLQTNSQNYSVDNMIQSRRRRLLQANGVAFVEPFINLDTQQFHKESVTGVDKIEYLTDFRLTIRLRLDLEAPIHVPGRIVSNSDTHLTSSHDTTGNNGPGDGVDLTIDLVNDHKLRIHVCGNEYISYQLERGVWYEFAVAVTRQSLVAIILNSEVIGTASFSTCTIKNHVITLGKSQEFLSAVGVHVQYVFLNSYIRVNGMSVYTDVVLKTDVVGVEWTIDEFDSFRSTITAHVAPLPVSMHVQEDDDGNAVVYLRLFLRDETTNSADIIPNIMALMNNELTRMNSHELFIQSGINPIGKFYVPFLELTYERSRPLYCDIVAAGEAEFIQTCLYDELQLGAHSVTVNGQLVYVDYTQLSNTYKTLDFVNLQYFQVLAEDLTTSTGKYWGGGQDCELQFFVRTGPDSIGALIDLVVEIPINFGFYQVLKVRIHKTTQSASGDGVWLQVFFDPTNNFIEHMMVESTGFQHVRVVFRASIYTSYIEIWIDGIRIAALPNIGIEPHQGLVRFESRNRLDFKDSFRELSSIHFASTTADTCQCRSQCAMDFYGASCEACPPHSGTLNNGTVYREECVCKSGFIRAAIEDPDTCVPNTIQAYTEYNVSLSLLRGHCIADTNEDGKCMQRAESDGCSCDDDCVYAREQDQQCCRNKCSVCPTQTRVSATESKAICLCKWNATNAASYNAAFSNSTLDSLCSAAFCGVGERGYNGICIACESGKYQPTVMSTENCLPCPTCSTGMFLSGCRVGNKGVCLQCSETCESQGLTESLACTSDSDRVCVNSTSCEGIGASLDCPIGSYHSGCHPEIGEKGSCERCPVQSADECPQGFFLNFNCNTEGTVLPQTPNECIPCNRFTCKTYGKFPSRYDCGDKLVPDTMDPTKITCSHSCKIPTGDQFIERECQYFIPKTDVYDESG